MREKLAWDVKNGNLEDIDRIVLLIDELGSVEYWGIQRMIRENGSVFKECFKRPGDVQGTSRPTSRALNYYLNTLEIFNKIRCENGKFHKTKALEIEANRIRVNKM